jgi:signal transduction histidine kinase
MSREEYALLWNTISSGGTWKGEFHNRKKNGELYWEAASISPILDHEGKVANYIAIKEDITERKLLEEDLAQAGKKLAIMNSITRHDVLNSILIIEGSTALLAKNPQTAAANLDRIHRAAETIKQQMAFAKLYQDIGAQVPAWQSILLSVIKAKASLDNKGLDIRMIGKDYEVRADPMFEKVIFNLFDNAIRHAAGATRVVLSTHEERGTLVIEVEDDGAGISGEDREHLFERGYGKNTGYGLFLSREILGITGISIEERGEAGKGARFVISVPSLDWRTSK